MSAPITAVSGEFTRIDLDTWYRREHYHFFKDYDLPYFNVCAELDVSMLVAYCRTHQCSLNLALLYLAVSTAHRVPAFQLRKLEDDVVQFKTLHASSTIMGDSGAFQFCWFDWYTQFSAFQHAGKAAIAQRKQETSLFSDGMARQDVLHFSSIPWASFTSITNARKIGKDDTVPKIIFGKHQQKAARVMMPISIELHHALADGSDTGEYLHIFQEQLNDVANVLALQ